MDDYIEYILKLVRPYSEDLDEREHFLEKRWLEISDRDDDTNIVMHVFKPDFSPDGIGSGEMTYMRVVNGNVSMGIWSTIANTNTMLLKEGGHFELFDMAFMNGDFIVLKKHRNQHTPILGSKYLFFARENMVKSGDNVMPWMDILELWFNVYRLNSFWITVVVLVIIFGIFILILSTI
ncbi:MAG: hypothetical protein HC803_03605 [Saprospiraceae bacterium]|nr:hypothetical protein [Saprospiraceae bacterium]